MKKIFLVFALIFSLSTNNLKAAEVNLPPAGLLPSNFLYIIDMISESIGNVFTFGDVSRAKRYLNLASERLAEVKDLINEGKNDKVEKTLLKYGENIDSALDNLNKAEENGKDDKDVLENVADATSKHLDVLNDVLEKVPEQAKESIRNAIQKSDNGHQTAIQAIEKNNSTSTDSEQDLDKNKNKKFDISTTSATVTTSTSPTTSSGTNMNLKDKSATGTKLDAGDKDKKI